MDLAVSNKLPIFALDINHMVWKMISNNYTYDLSGNPQKIYFTNGSITKYVYSATGQKLRMVHYTAKANITRTIGQQVELKASEIQSTDSTVTRPFTGSATKTVTYTYDMRGWLTSITTNSFAEELFYADGPGTKLYNGNISSMRWKNGSYSSVKRGYKFTYDAANRLKNAVYGEKDNLGTNANRFTEKVLEYDKNGNIKRLERRGRMQTGSYGVVDNLTIAYSGNIVNPSEAVEFWLYTWE